MSYKILDLFAGAGGLSLGFEETGLFSVAAIVENNKNAATTYKKNHEKLHYYEDILNVDFKELQEKTGKIDVVIGGPPCQGFSNANRQRRQLINGSNELVKRYVKAIEEVKPDVFVMENVKTIASEKQFFCVTKDDKDYIENKLNLQTYEKDVTLYEGSQETEVYDLYKTFKGNIHDLTILSEEQIYIIYNIYKKRQRLKNYFSKEINVKRVTEIVGLLQEQSNFPDWYNAQILDAREILGYLLETKANTTDDNINKLKEFWNVLRFYQGIKELENKKAIYKVIPSSQAIVVKMRTYIVIDFVKRAFDDLDYETNGDVLNAAWFGVPQTRERFILIGVKRKYRKLTREEIKLPEPIIDISNDFITVEEAIGDLEKYEPTTVTMNADIEIEDIIKPNTYFKKLVSKQGQTKIFNHVCTQSSEATIERFRQIKPGDNFHSLPDDMKSTYENPGRTQNTIYRRLDATKPSDTVVNVRKSMWIHPNLDRAISAREAARLQSFPDWYKFYGTKDSVYQQIGNAVPPLLGRAVAESVLELLGNSEEYTDLRTVYNEK